MGDIADNDFVIKTSELSKRYGKTPAVNGLGLSVRRGEVYGFLGPNGAGKTTTLRMLLGLIKPSSGSAAVLGKDPGEPEAPEPGGRPGRVGGLLSLYVGPGEPPGRSPSLWRGGYQGDASVRC